MEEQLLHTPLADRHVALGARMVPFAGWNMPVQYGEGILAEHRQCRTAAALFDICHMGEFRISGASAAADLDRILARPVLEQAANTCRYNFLLNDQAGVLDDLIVYRLAEDEFFLVVNAGPRVHDAAWIQARLSPLTSFVDESDATAKLDLQGPQSAAVLARLGLPIDRHPAYYRFLKTRWLDVPLLISRTGYTGERGFELYFPAGEAGRVWDAILAVPGVKPAGLGARDTLRLEMGYPLYGHEMDEATTPVEAGFGAMLKLDRPREFIGSEVLRDPVRGRPRRRLLGFRLDSRRAARHGAAILFDGRPVGAVTSGAVAPSLDIAVAMGYVDADLALPPGAGVGLDAGKAILPATVASLPFYTAGTARA
jgi:aminomethyltransferase